MNQLRYDLGKLDRAAVNDKGYLKADAFATRTGIFTYMMMDGTLRRELRPPEEVFNQDSMNSLSEVVITNNHPPESLNSKNTKKYAAGWTGKEVKKVDQYIQVQTNITDFETINDIMKNGKQQLSCGYNCDIENISGEFDGQRYDAIQRNIRYNHLSVVDQGRAGPEVKIRTDSDGKNIDIGIMKTDNDDKNKKKDGADLLNHVSSLKISKNKELKMTKIKIDGVEYEISETLAPIIVAQLKELESIKADKTSVLSEKEKLQGKCDGLESELKINKEKVSELEKAKISDEEILQRADALNKIVGLAKKVIGEDFKLDGRSIDEVKKEIVAKSKPELKLDGKSNDYIDGIFSAMSLDSKEFKDDTLINALSGNVTQSNEKLDSKKARINSINKDVEHFNSYKGV